MMDDANAMTGYNSGDLDFMQNPPPDEVATLLADGTLIAGDYLGTYYACFNNSKAPFDDVNVRKAFNLAIDRNYIVEMVTQAGEIPAGAWVPESVVDAEGTDGPDFREVGGDFWSTAEEDYEANCEQARELLAQAGYPNGEGFPETTYLYNTDDKHQAVAEALQQMWRPSWASRSPCATRSGTPSWRPVSRAITPSPATAGPPTTTTPCPSWICSSPRRQQRRQV